MSKHPSLGSVEQENDLMLPGRQNTRVETRSSVSVRSVHSDASGLSRPGRNLRTLRFGIVAVLACLGLGISSYLTYSGFTGTSVAGCDGGTFDCGHVLSSRWSKIGGIPVGLPAALVYATVLGCLMTGGLSSRGTQTQRNLLALLLVVAASAAVWFIALQFVLGKFCFYCCIAHGCSLILALLVLPQLNLGGARLAKFAGVGVLATTGLALIQYQTEPPPTFRIETHDNIGAVTLPAETNHEGDGVFDAPDIFAAPSESDSPVFEAPVFEAPVFEAPAFETPADESSGESAEPSGASAERSASSVSLGWVAPLVGLTGVLQVSGAGATASQSTDSESDAAAESDVVADSEPGPRLVPVSSGRRQLQVGQWPLIGDKDARYIFVAMFDYTCSHCRTTYQAIQDAREQGLDVAVVSLPIPLHQSCNDAAKNNDPENAQRCDVAKLAIAVWLAQPDQFEVFHRWLLDRYRSAPEARRKAAELVGERTLREKLASPIPAAFVAKNVFLYKEAGAGALPKLVFPRTTVVGEVSSGTTIANLVRSNLP